MKRINSLRPSKPASWVALVAAASIGFAPTLSFAAGGGGGGGGGGGSTTVCTFINDFKVTSGYTPSSNSSLGAVWVQWKLNSCTSPSGLGIDILVRLTDKSAGVLLYSIPGWYAQQTIDFDNLKTGTAYHVDFTISDHGTGIIIESRSADVATPSHNAAGI